MDDQVDESVKADRLSRLQALLNEQQVAFNEGCVGKTIPVLLEKPGRGADQLIGRSPWLQSVIVPSNVSAIGDIVEVSIAKAAPNSLQAVSAV